MSSYAESIQLAAWRRLKKNRGAVLGMVIIILTLLTAVFGYFLAPDGSPDANRMIVEIGGLKPGKQQMFYKVKKERPPVRRSFIQRLIYGQEDGFSYMPVKRYLDRGNVIVIEKYIDEDVYDTLSVPRSVLAAPLGSNFTTTTYLLGTDKYGRDILSRLLLGSRVSLSVGAIAIIISLTIGVILGAAAGYFRGRTDNVIMWLINVIWSIPTLLLVFAITFLLGKGFWQVFVAVGLTMWVSVARIVRGQILSVRKREYVEAARALGFSDLRIITRHILPNIAGPIIVIAASNFASAIVIEAGLSFLGVGVQPPQPSWGMMIKENYNFIITNNPMLALAPGFAIMLLVLAFNLLGNGLRDALDVKG
ncbi:MAG: ABC transporter permease [Chitinophagaceae bacterium]|nr:ABC transporter permease [Chitinophagaceae bacterium]